MKKRVKDESVVQSADLPDGERTDVEVTLSDIKQQSKSEQTIAKKKRNPFLTAVMIIFFPVTAVVFLLQKIFRKINLPITAKMTIIYTFIFTIVLVVFTVFYMESMRKWGTTDSEYMQNLRITSSILVIVVVAMYAATVWLSSQFMLKPIRSITDKIDEVKGDNLSARLDQVDSQDELMELTNRINKMLDNLEQSFLRQQNFVADASHELKTPISVIQGYSNMLMRWGKSDPKILDEGIDAISRESENMKRIVEQLLLLARLGNFSLNRTEFNLVEVVSEIADSYKMLDFKHAISFKRGADNITVNADKNLLTESIRAIVDNAIKYTPEDGKIVISCGLCDGKPNIAVADTGIGIKQEDLPHIFERFYRCDKARGREKGSSGLGLSIAKSIVETMGGNIDVQSTVGSGTTFTISL